MEEIHAVIDIEIKEQDHTSIGSGRIVPGAGPRASGHVGGLGGLWWLLRDGGGRVGALPASEQILVATGTWPLLSSVFPFLTSKLLPHPLVTSSEEISLLFLSHSSYKANTQLPLVWLCP